MSQMLALARLWSYLQAMPGGFRFERDVMIGAVRVALCCRQTRVVIDVADVGTDGIDRLLARQGYRVMRFSRCAIMGSMADVCAEIVRVCRQRRPRPFAGIRRMAELK
ncbi:MAG: DUF559 domain-containing protein [Candidatus Kapabacteria bacterium]|nr:DUF559 domain-containing protein [Candidatus Kapabacteria bacterium]